MKKRNTTIQSQLIKEITAMLHRTEKRMMSESIKRGLMQRKVRLAVAS